jgi:hypothetical protein
VFAIAAGANISIAWVVDGVISAISTGPLYESAQTSAARSNAAAKESSDPRTAEVERLDSRIGGLLLGLGLKGHARSAFAPTNPNPLDSVDLLDTRVDRLLVGIGQDPHAQSAYVLVALDASAPEVSQRWAVISQDRLAS